MSDLVLCLVCERHSRPGESRCPFCGEALATPQAITRAPRGLSRAKLYALHTAALAAVAVACGGGTTTGSDASTDGNANDGTAKDSSTDGTSSDAIADGNSADTGGNDASTDVVEDDGWGPPPPPYGCVFPGGCKSVIV